MTQNWLDYNREEKETNTERRCRSSAAEKTRAQKAAGSSGLWLEGSHMPVAGHFKCRLPFYEQRRSYLCCRRRCGPLTAQRGSSRANAAAVHPDGAEADLIRARRADAVRRNPSFSPTPAPLPEHPSSIQHLSASSAVHRLREAPKRGGGGRRERTCVRGRRAGLGLWRRRMLTRWAHLLSPGLKRRGKDAKSIREHGRWTGRTRRATAGGWSGRGGVGDPGGPGPGRGDGEAAGRKRGSEGLTYKVSYKKSIA